jgi:hypothetical protein
MKRRAWVLAVMSLGCASVARAGAYEDFFRAVRLDDARTVRALLARGLDPNSPDEKGDPALVIALRDGSLEVALALLERPDLKVDAVNAADENALMMAALRGHIDWVQRLLERGAKVNREGWTPLHYAVSGSGTRIVSLLLDKGALIDARSPSQSTPLMMAAGYGAIDSADLLLRRGADPKARNDRDLTAADFARRAGRDALAERIERAAR